MNSINETLYIHQHEVCLLVLLLVGLSVASVIVKMRKDRKADEENHGVNEHIYDLGDQKLILAEPTNPKTKARWEYARRSLAMDMEAARAFRDMLEAAERNNYYRRE